MTKFRLICLLAMLAVAVVALSSPALAQLSAQRDLSRKTHEPFSAAADRTGSATGNG